MGDIELALHRDLEDYFPLEMCDAKGFCLGEEIVVRASSFRVLSIRNT